MCRSVEFTDDIVLMATDSVGDGKIRSLFGVHDITLAEGVSEKQFEAFLPGDRR